MDSGEIVEEENLLGFLEHFYHFKLFYFSISGFFFWKKLKF